MKPTLKDNQNNWPLLADFNNRDVDGAVRNIFPFTNLNFVDISLVPESGQKIWLSDGDIEVHGTLIMREGNWIAIPDEEGYKDVDKSYPYHNNNLTKE